MGKLRDAAERQHITDLRRTADKAETFLQTSGHLLTPDQREASQEHINARRKQADQAERDLH